MSMLSRITKNKEFMAGSFIEPTAYCVSNWDKGCKRFYSDIESNNQFIECPHGMTVYPCESGDVYCSFRVRNKFKKDRARKEDSKKVCYNPVLDEDKALMLIKNDIDNNRRETMISEREDYLNDFFHEIKQLNAQIKEKSDDILQNNKVFEGKELSEGTEAVEKLREGIRTVYLSSSLIAARFQLSDFERNPGNLRQGSKTPIVVYKKFDKMSRILNNYQRNGVSFKIKGNSYLSIDAYAVFEFIPLLILENAAKYSFKNGVVEVFFDESKKSEKVLTVRVESFGPLCKDSEYGRIYERGFRGENAKKKGEGAGIGLYFVKQICDLHDIHISASSDSTRITNVSGVPHAPFTVSLEFHDVLDDC